MNLNALYIGMCLSATALSSTILPLTPKTDDNVGYISLAQSDLVELAVDNVLKGVQQKNYNIIKDVLTNDKGNADYKSLFDKYCFNRSNYLNNVRTPDALIDFGISIKGIEYQKDKAYVHCKFLFMCSPELTKEDTLVLCASGNNWRLQNMDKVLDFISINPKHQANSSACAAYKQLLGNKVDTKTGFGSTFIQQNASSSGYATFRRLTKERTLALIQRRLFNDIYASCTVYHYDPQYGYSNKIEVVTDPNWDRFVYGDYEKYLKSSDGIGNLVAPKGITYARNGKYFIANSYNNSIAVYRHNMANNNSTVNYLGEITTLNGAAFSQPTDVYADNNGTWMFTGQTQYNAEADDWLWIVDAGNNRICRTVIAPGQVGANRDFVYGSLGSGVGQFNNPMAIAAGKKTYYWRPSQGSMDSVLVTVNSKDVYVIDHGNHRIVWLEKTYDSNPDNDPYTKFLHIVTGVVWKGVYQGPEQSDFYSIETDGFGNVYVADRENCQILKFDKYLNFIFAYGSPGKGQNNDDTFWYPIHVNNPLYTYVSPAWQTWVPLSTDALMTCERWTDQSGGLRHQLGVDVVNCNAVLSGYDLYYAFTLTDYAKVTVTAVCSDGSNLTFLNNVALSAGMYRNTINSGKVITSMIVSASSFYKKSDGTPTVQIRKTFAPAAMPNDAWYVESSGDTVHTSVNYSNTSGNGAELVLYVDSTITPGAWLNDYPCLRKNIVTPVIAINPQIDMVLSWTQRDYDHALHFELLMKGEDNVNRWLIYAPNASNHWTEPGYVNMGESSVNYSDEESFVRNICLDYYLTFNKIKPVQIEGMRIAHFYNSGWAVGNHGGYVKDIAFSEQDRMFVQVQNQLMDQGNRTDIGTVYIANWRTSSKSDNWYQSPCTTGTRTVVKMMIGAQNTIDYPASVQNIFCGWSDGGASMHFLGAPIASCYTAYYKKRPLLSASASGGHLTWDWQPGTRPPSFQRFELWRYGVGVIWTGTSNTLTYHFSSNAFIRLYAVLNIGGEIIKIPSLGITVTPDAMEDPPVTLSFNNGATAYSNGKKLAIGNDGNLHVTYTSGDTVLYAISADDGKTWNGFAPVGFGTNPAIELRTVTAKGSNTTLQTPSICFASGNRLFLAEKSETGSWNQPQSVYQGQPDEEISYLSYVLNRQNNNACIGWVSSTPDGSRVLSAPYAPGAKSQLVPRIIDSGPGQDLFKSPSLTFDWSGNLLTVWSRAGLVKYSDPVYSAIELSSPDKRSIHPIVSTYGDRTSVTWMEQTSPVSKNEPGKYQIVCREKTPTGWGEPRVISFPDSGDAQFPVAAGHGQYVYAKETGNGNYDINYYGSYANNWETYVQNISYISGGQSGYPDLVYRPSWPNHKLYILWTETDTMPQSKALLGPINKVKLHVKSIEPVPVYGVYPNANEQSTYTTQRAGAFYYGSGQYNTVDYHPDKLIYHFDKLDPKMKYQVKAVYCRPPLSPLLGNEGNKSGGHNDDWREMLKADQTELKLTQVPETTVVKEIQLIPKHCYSDGQVDISIERKAGDYAICAGLELIVYEDEKGGHDGGGQMETMLNLPVTYQFKLMQSAPNPTTGKAVIAYQIADVSQVSLKIYNTLGQTVKTMVDEVKQPGAYQIAWNGKDNAGKPASAGVYFYRLISGGKTDTKKMVMIR